MNQGRYVLKKIYFLVDYVSQGELLGEMFLSLWKSGMEALRLEAKEGEAFVQDLEGFLAKEKLCKEEILVVTDSLAVGASLEEKGIPVIGYLHEKNQAVGFSKVKYLIEDLSGLDVEYARLVYARKHGYPLEILETERCLVREITPEDVDRLYEIYEDPGITEYMENLYEDPDEERAYTKDYIRLVYGFYGFGMWLVVRKTDGRIIGRAGLDPKEDGVELGYMIEASLWNQGYATEVCRQILAYAEQKEIPELYARTRSENVPSVRVLEKLGFRRMKEEKKQDGMDRYTLRLLL